MTRFEKLVKRAFDLGVTLMATVVLLPLALMVALVIFVSSRGPILYRSERVGKGGKRFIVYKFRTMVPGSDTLGPKLTHRGDPRITRIGRVFRRSKFDEFPQVINVLRGEMSIVGPRPECPEYVSFYSSEQIEVLRMKPGLTSLAQVIYRDEEAALPDRETEAYYIEEVLPRKLALDLYYVQYWSFVLDLRVFVLGLLALVKVSPPAVLWPLKPERTSLV